MATQASSLVASSVMLEKELDFENWKSDQLELAKPADGRLHITIDQTSFDKIADRRQKALFDSYHFSSGKFYVPATFKYHGKTFKGKI